MKNRVEEDYFLLTGCIGCVQDEFWKDLQSRTPRAATGLSGFSCALTSSHFTQLSMCYKQKNRYDT